MKWLFPNGDDVPIVGGRDAVGTELFTQDFPGAVVLQRGPTHFNPDGEHCCVRNDGTLTRCVTFSEC